MIEAPDLISATEASRRAGVTLHTLMRWVKEGRLTAYRAGGPRPGRAGEPKTYIEVEQLAALLAERETIRPV